MSVGNEEEKREDQEGDYDSFFRYEKIVSQYAVSVRSRTLDIKMPVPIAIIVCEGDFKTIGHISKALQNTFPVIIIKGSGKAADLVSDYLENENVLSKTASVYIEDTKYAEVKTHLEIISKNKNLVGIFDLNQHDPLMLSNIVGETVIIGWSLNNLTQKCRIGNTPQNIQMADENADLKKKDRASVTMDLISKKSIHPVEIVLKRMLKRFKIKSKPCVINPKYSKPTSLPLYFYFGYQLLQESKCLDECAPSLLLEALKINHCYYVRLLLNKGVNFRIDDLQELYRQAVSCQDCKFKKEDCLHMQWILKQIEEPQAKKLLRKKKKYQGVPDAAKSLCRRILQYKNYKDNTVANISQENDKSNIADILLWAIFANRKELAEICWLRGRNHLLTGLVCSAVLKKLSKKARNVKEHKLSTELDEHSKLFEQRCIALMDSMYNENTRHAMDLMDDEAVVWGIRSSPLTFAHENFMYEIVAHTCSQKNMNKLWYNNLPPDLKPFLKSAFSKPKQFITAPLTKFSLNYMLFFTMLVMYSAFVLSRISTKYYRQSIARVFEYYVYIWGAGDFIEELFSCFGCLEAYGRSHRNYYSRMKRYLYDFWNAVDLLSYVLLIAALFVRHFYIDETFTIARRMFALSLLVMYLRFLEVFLIHRKLGPTLIMIKEMLKDLLGFLLIAVFVVLGVGIYYHANLWPDHQTILSGDWTNWRIWTIIYYPYWQLYAELNLENLDGSEQSDCTNVTSVWESDTSINRCPQQDWTVQAVAAIYLLFSNLLLVNLVIAMFSYTFERVQENSEKLWRFERYTMVNDYEWRIPSPINLFFLPYRLFCCQARDDCCLHMCRKMCNKEKQEDSKAQREINEKFRRNLQRIFALRNHSQI